jgi:hypothetical protein
MSTLNWRRTCTVLATTTAALITVVDEFNELDCITFKNKEGRHE